MLAVARGIFLLFTFCSGGKNVFNIGTSNLFYSLQLLVYKVAEG